LSNEVFSSIINALFEDKHHYIECSAQNPPKNIRKIKMKADIHPSYAQVKVTCSCGEVFNTRSTSSKDISIEVCSVCHPFYTGKQKIVDTAGRVERFKQKYANRGVKTGE
jgi:large subunit ribosomal protein L31